MSKKSNKHLTEEELWNCIDDESTYSSFQEHLESCQTCSKLLTELKLVHSDLLQLTTYEPSPDFSQQVVSRWKTSRVEFPWFVPALISFFVLIFGLSIHLSLQAEVQVSATFIQGTSFVIVVCVFWFIDFLGRGYSTYTR